MRGQIILILVLVMTAALGVGLTVIQRSLTDVSTSTKVEQSSRAFSAAEAGIERALSTGSIGNFTIPSQELQNESQATYQVTRVPGPGQTFELQAQGGDRVAHVWLANPATPTNPPNPIYTGNTLDIFWGDVGGSNPAIAITVVYLNNGSPQIYRSRKYYIDGNVTRAGQNGFCSQPCLPAVTNVSCPSSSIPTSESAINKNFYCQARIDISSAVITDRSRLILLRMRLLYTDTAHSIAIRPTSGSLPYQASKIISTGVAGDTSRTIYVTQEDQVVPEFFDYAIFSAGDITK